MVKINSVTQKQSNETQNTNNLCSRNPAAEQKARNVIPGRAKITKTQIKMFVKSEQQKKEEREV